MNDTKRISAEEAIRELDDLIEQISTEKCECYTSNTTSTNSYEKNHGANNIIEDTQQIRARLPNPQIKGAASLVTSLLLSSEPQRS